MVRIGKRNNGGGKGKGGVTKVRENMIDPRLHINGSTIVREIRNGRMTNECGVKERSKNGSEMRPGGVRTLGRIRAITQRILDHVPITNQEIKEGKLRKKTRTKGVEKGETFGRLCRSVNVCEFVQPPLECKCGYQNAAVKEVVELYIARGAFEKDRGVLVPGGNTTPFDVPDSWVRWGVDLLQTEDISRPGPKQKEQAGSVVAVCYSANIKG
jgi:hypothetical protein